MLELVASIITFVTSIPSSIAKCAVCVPKRDSGRPTPTECETFREQHANVIDTIKKAKQDKNVISLSKQTLFDIIGSGFSVIEKMELTGSRIAPQLTYSRHAMQPPVVSDRKIIYDIQSSKMIRYRWVLYSQKPIYKEFVDKIYDLILDELFPNPIF